MSQHDETVAAPPAEAMQIGRYGLTIAQLEQWITPYRAAKNSQIRCRPQIIIDLIEAGSLRSSARRVGGSDDHPRYVVQLKHAIPAVHEHQRVCAKRKDREKRDRQELGLSRREQERVHQSILHPAAQKMLTAKPRSRGRKAG